MTSTSVFSKTLGQTLADASQICQITATGSDPIGINLSIVQTTDLDRNYRVKVPFNATGSGVWKRIVPYDTTETFLDQNHWAVDIMSVNNVTTLRLVRTRQGSPPSSTVLACKVIAFPSAGSTLAIADSVVTSSNVTNTGIFQGALITQMNGFVGINTDDASHTLDVLGNVNTSGAYRIQGTDVLTSNVLGPSVTTSSLTTVGTLSTVSVAGTVNLSGLGIATTPNVMYVNASTGLVSYGSAPTISGNVSVTNLTASGNVSATSLTGTLATSAQPNITSVGTLASLTVTGNVVIDSTTLTVNSVANRVGIATANPAFPLDVTGNTNLSVGSAYLINGVSVINGSALGSGITASNLTSVGTLSSLIVTGNVAAGNVSGTTLSGTFLQGTLQTAAQPNVTSVGTLGALTVSGNVAAGNVTASTLGGTLSTAAQPNITSVGTLTSLNVTGNLTAGNVSGTTLSGTFLQGTLQTASQSNITSVGTLSSLNVSGNVSVANLHSNQVVNTGTAYRIGNVNILTATALGTSVVNSSLTSVGTLSSLTVTGNVAAGNLSTNTISATALRLNGADWASSVIRGTTTPFLYTGPGTALSNGVPFFDQTQANGTAFVSASGNNNSIFTFSTSGSYMLQAEIDVGFPWMPDGDISTYYIVNANVANRRGRESHAPSNFSCTSPYLLPLNASDNVRFVIDSSSGNDYEVGLNSVRLTMLKLT